MSTKPAAFFEGTEMPTAGWWEALWPDPADVLAKVGVAPGMEVIDLCCGDGWFTLPSAKIVRRVIAIDIDPDMLEVARRRLTQSDVTNCDFLSGDAYELHALWPGPVDLVFFANASHGVPDRPRLSRVVCEVLRPGGRLAIVNWHRRPREETRVLGEPRGPRSDLRLSPEQITASIEAGGLKLLHVVELPPYHYAAIFERPA